MNANEPAADGRPPPRQPGPADLARLGIRVAVAVVAMSMLVVLVAGTPGLTFIPPRWVFRTASIAFLWALLASLALAVPAVVFGGALSCLAVWRAWRRRDRVTARRRMRWVSLAMSGALSLAVMELVSGAALRRSRAIPDLPTRFPPPSERVSTATTEGSGSTGADDRGLSIVVVGESSALGQPYDPRVSIGLIVAWQLERVFPGRPIAVDVRAGGGYTLAQAIGLLEDLEHRPDAIILFSGHNEFLTRFGYARAVRHYADDGPEGILSWLERARALSSTTRLILDTLDRQYGEASPPANTRALIDHPICTPEEYAATLEGFRRALEALANYCARIGALPVFIVPASNDGAFEPNRSVLAGGTPRAARAEFERAFRAARGLENSDPSAATSAFRRLVDRHPEFAEGHYRLAHLLAKAGAWDEARPQFVAARDRDAAPQRCPTDFRQAIKAVGRRHGAILIDCEATFTPLGRRGILDDHLFHDAHHPNLPGYAAVAREILEQLHRRRVWGWPEASPVPRIDVAECARHFKIGRAELPYLCKGLEDWYRRAAVLRHDGTERRQAADAYEQAGRAALAGRTLPASSPPSLVAVLSITDDAKPREP